MHCYSEALSVLELLANVAMRSEQGWAQMDWAVLRDLQAPSPSQKPCSGTHPNLVHHYLCCKWLKERLSTRAKSLVRHSVPCATEVQTKLGRETPRQYLNLQRRVWISAPTASGKCTAHNLLRAPMHWNRDQIGTQQNQTCTRSTTAISTSAFNGEIAQKLHFSGICLHPCPWPQYCNPL